MSAIGTKQTCRDKSRCPLSGAKRTGLPDETLSAVDPKRTSGRHPNKPFQSGIVSLSAGWVGRMNRARRVVKCAQVLDTANRPYDETPLLHRGLPSTPSRCPDR